MKGPIQTDQRKTVWATLVVFVAILFWNSGYNAAKFANGVPIDLGMMDALQLACLVFLAGFVVRHRQWL